VQLPLHLHVFACNLLMFRRQVRAAECGADGEESGLRLRPRRPLQHSVVQQVQLLDLMIFMPRVIHSRLKPNVRELRRQALQFAREKEVLAAKLQDMVTRQAASASSNSPNRRRSTLLTQQRVALEAVEMQQWREQQEFESKHTADAARIAELEAALAVAKEKAEQGKEKEVQLMKQIAELKDSVAQRDEQLLALAECAAEAPVAQSLTPSKALFNTSATAALCLSPCSSLTSRVMSPSATRPPPSPCTSRSDAALAAAEAQIAQVGAVPCAP
jgi:hypothetical protein